MPENTPTGHRRPIPSGLKLATVEGIDQAVNYLDANGLRPGTRDGRWGFAIAGRIPDETWPTFVEAVDGTLRATIAALISDEERTQATLERQTAATREARSVLRALTDANNGSSVEEES